MNSTVSIVVPVYNAASCIADTIMSVQKQKYTDYELLLVDDASSDDSRKIIEGFLSDRIRLLTNTEGKGAAGARNTGISQAKGRYIAFIDADDLWTEDKLEKQVRFMQEKDAASLRTLAGTGSWIPRISPQLSPEQNSTQSMSIQSPVTVKRKICSPSVRLTLASTVLYSS